MTNSAFAGHFYIGPSAFVQIMSAQDSNYFGIHPPMDLAQASYPACRLVSIKPFFYGLVSLAHGFRLRQPWAPVFNWVLDF